MRPGDDLDADDLADLAAESGHCHTSAVGAATAIPSNYLSVVDQGRANDVNAAQVDLTRFGRDDSNASLYKLFWSWDATDQWTGTGQTGDACALFDSNGDGKVDTWEYYVKGALQKVGTDSDGDGQPDQFNRVDGK